MIERRKFGKTTDELSVLGFGGVIVMNATPEESANTVAQAFDAGITYFDVAPFYGNAQEMLGPALAPYRDRCFLACKTRDRTAEGARLELENSLQLLQTDRFDLYQLHSLQSVTDDVNVALGPGGAMETIVRARDEGKIRHIGFSAHTEEAAHAAMDQFDFDSILFPVNYYAWTNGNFGRSVVQRARDKGMAVLALKSLAHRAWTKPEWKTEGRPWPKCWYKALVEDAHIEAALRFTLSQSIDAAIPPGHWEFFQRCLDIVSNGASNAGESWDILDTVEENAEPLFATA